jgi:hypothetical protein
MFSGMTESGAEKISPVHMLGSDWKYMSMAVAPPLPAVVDLSGNQISGQIPVSLVKLRRLYVLHLQDNRLRGTIPPLWRCCSAFSCYQCYGWAAGSAGGMAKVEDDWGLIFFNMFVFLIIICFIIFKF